MVDRVIKIRLDADGNYTQVIEDATDETRQFNRTLGQSKREVDTFGRATEALGRQFRRMGQGIAGIAGDIARSFQPSSFQSIFDVADEIGKAANRLGVTTDALQEYRVAAGLTGVTNEELAKGLETLNRRIGEQVQQISRQSTGVQASGRAFDVLGVQVLDAAGNIRSTQTILDDVADGLAAIESGSLRSALAQEVFGRAGTRLLNTVAGGAAGLQEMRDRARDLGLVLEEYLIRQAEAANDEFSLLQQQVEVNFVRAALTIAPVIQTLSSSLQEVAKWLNNVWLLWLEVQRAMELGGMQATIEENNRLRRSLIERNQVLERSKALFEEGMSTQDLWTANVSAGIEQTGDWEESLRSLNEEMAANREENLRLEGETDNLLSTMTQMDEQIDRLKRGLDETAGFPSAPLPKLNEEVKKLPHNLRSAAEGARVFHENTQRGVDELRDYQILLQHINQLIESNPDGIFGDPQNRADEAEAWSESIARITSDYARLFAAIDEGWAQTTSRALTAISAISTTIQGVTRVAASGGADIGGWAQIAAGAGTLIQSLFGGGQPPSPELAIGGPATTTGQRAGTQGVSAFGSFGLRDPRGPDPATQLRSIAQLIANTENRIASFLTAGQIGAVRGAGRIELLADSDDQDEVNNIVNQWFKNTLDAIDTTLGDIFDAETIGGLLDPAIGADIAASLVEVSDAFERLGLTLSEEFVDAVGGAQEALRLTNNYIERFFTPAEVAEINLDRANNVLQEQFGDLVDTFGITFENFREIFEDVSPEGEDLARWLRLAEALGIVEDAQQAYNDTLVEADPVIDDVVESTAQLVVQTAQLSQAEQNLLNTRRDEFVAVNESMRQLRLGIADLEQGNQSLLDVYISQQGRINFLITTLVTGVDGLAGGLNEFLASVQQIVNFIDNTIAGINQSIARQQLDIGLDALANDQARYDFLQRYIDQQTDLLAGLTDPQEIARVTSDIQSAVARQWSLLPESERQRLGGDFIAFLDSLGIESTGLLEATREMVISNANLTIAAATVRIEGLENQSQLAADANRAGFDMVFAANTMVTAARMIDTTFRRGFKVRVAQPQAQNA